MYVLHLALKSKLCYTLSAVIQCKKDEVFPYSFLSVGPGADPGIEAFHNTDTDILARILARISVESWNTAFTPHATVYIIMRMRVQREASAGQLEGPQWRR